MTGLNFRHISFFTGNLALSSTKYVQDGSDILLQGTGKNSIFCLVKGKLILVIIMI